MIEWVLSLKVDVPLVVTSVELPVATVLPIGFSSA